MSKIGLPEPTGPRHSSACRLWPQPVQSFAMSKSETFSARPKSPPPRPPSSIQQVHLSSVTNHKRPLSSVPVQVAPLQPPPQYPFSPLNLSPQPQTGIFPVPFRSHSASTEDTSPQRSSRPAPRCRTPPSRLPSGVPFTSTLKIPFPQLPEDRISGALQGNGCAMSNSQGGRGGDKIVAFQGFLYFPILSYIPLYFSIISLFITIMLRCHNRTPCTATLKATCCGISRGRRRGRGLEVGGRQDVVEEGACTGRRCEVPVKVVLLQDAVVVPQRGGGGRFAKISGWKRCLGGRL